MKIKSPPLSFQDLSTRFQLKVSRGHLKEMYLTQKELHCLYYFLSGHTTKQTGYLLKMSPRTAETHLRNVRYKLGCRHRWEVFRVLFPEFTFSQFVQCVALPFPPADMTNHDRP